MSERIVSTLATSQLKCKAQRSFVKVLGKRKVILSRTTDAQCSLFSMKSRTLGQTNSGAFGVFSAKLSAPILHSESLDHVFHCSTIISTKNYFYIRIPNIHLGLGSISTWVAKNPGLSLHVSVVRA